MKRKLAELVFKLDLIKKSSGRPEEITKQLRAVFDELFGLKLTIKDAILIKHSSDNIRQFMYVNKRIKAKIHILLESIGDEHQFLFFDVDV